jgi:predicted enzyme related to lactoylglutathione lyase/catechol 2,3-dioxygenase-like lactoylglutathione lyase family enzyme
MRRLLLTVLACGCLLGRAGAQDAALVVGSGNFFSPIVANLERAIAFYHDGLGFDVMGAPSTAADNAPIRNMFGLPDAQLRWTVARPAGSRQGVEIVEITAAGGRPLARRVIDPGAMTLVMSTTEPLNTIVTRALAHGGTRISVPRENPGSSIAVIKDPDDHFVQVVAAGTGATPLPPRIRLTVQNLGRALSLYRDALGLHAAASATPDERVTAALGLTRKTQVEAAALEVPGSTLTIEFIRVGGGTRSNARLQDPGSTRLQLQVRDLDAAIQAVVRAGGRVVSSGGMPVELPAGRGTPLRAAIVQDPDNLFLVLIQSAAPRT